jgi:Protein of unknown function (DUF1488)
MQAHRAAGMTPFQENRDEQRQQGIEEAQAGGAGEDARHGHNNANAGERVQTRAAQEMANDVTDPAAAAPLPPPFFHQDSECVRFWVQVPGGVPIGAILTKPLLHYRFDAKPDGSDAVAIYEKHRSDIDAAVLTRVASGSIEPVMLREHDLPPRPRG